ncbi:MAG: hypothetical protein V1802_00995 [Candidatus Aenigmatarchaeota archaeon]
MIYIYVNQKIGEEFRSPTYCGQMIKITIIAEKSFGYRDEDLSINIPEEGDLDNIVSDENIPKDREPKITTFTEYLGCTSQKSNRHLVHSFPAVEVYPFYMLWIEKRNEWVGIKYHYLGCDSELDGITECIRTAGPYKLNQKHAELIRQAYKNQIPIEEVLHASPFRLEGIASQK